MHAASSVDTSEYTEKSDIIGRNGMVKPRQAPAMAISRKSTRNRRPHCWVLSWIVSDSVKASCSPAPDDDLACLEAATGTTKDSEASCGVSQAQPIV